MMLPSHLRPINVDRIATCLNCGERLYARAGDWVPAYSQPVQQWVHWSENSRNRYCYVATSDEFLMAEVDLSTIEWVKQIISLTRRWGEEVLVVVDFYRPKHRRTYGVPICGYYPFALAS